MFDKVRSLEKLQALLDVILKVYEYLTSYMPIIEKVASVIEENPDMSDKDLAYRLAETFPIPNLINFLDVKVYEVLLKIIR